MAKDTRITEYERFVNQVAADTEVVKLVLTALVAKLADASGTQIVDDLEEVAKIALEKGSSEAAQNPLSNRLLHLKKSRADDYFRDLRHLVERLAPSQNPQN
jgi:hypothetical protein